MHHWLRDTLIEGFSHFVTSMTAPIASDWSDCRVGLAPTGKRRLSTAHANSGQSTIALSKNSVSARPASTIAGLPCAAKVTIALPKDPSADTQWDEEAAIIARICRNLIAAIRVKRTDASVTPLTAGDIGLLAPMGKDLWRFERALEAEGLSVASQAGKTLFLQQETQDVPALLRVLADA